MTSAFVSELPAALARDLEADPASFPELPGLPAGRFVAREFYDLERRSLWPRTWTLVGRLEEVNGHGQYFTWERTGVPLIIISSVDGAIRAFYNSCRHRGAPVVREPRGRSRALRCQYHSWTYDTTGRLVSVPDERDFVDLRFEERALVPVRCETWEGWLFVNEDAGAPSLAEAMSPVPARTVAGEGLRLLHRQAWPVAADWKLALAALQEDVAGAALLPRGDALVAPAPTGVPAAAVVFPNALLPLTGGQVAFSAWPTGHCLSEIEAIFLAPDWDEEDSPIEAPEWQARIAETAEVVNRAAASAAARQQAANGGETLAVAGRARAAWHLHEELDRRLASPGHLAVKPLLEPFVRTAAG